MTTNKEKMLRRCSAITETDDFSQEFRLIRVRAYTSLITELTVNHSEKSEWLDEDQVGAGIGYLSMEIEDLLDEYFAADEKRWHDRQIIDKGTCQSSIKAKEFFKLKRLQHQTKPGTNTGILKK